MPNPAQKKTCSTNSAPFGVKLPGGVLHDLLFFLGVSARARVGRLPIAPCLPSHDRSIAAPIGLAWRPGARAGPEFAKMRSKTVTYEDVEDTESWWR